MNNPLRDLIDKIVEYDTQEIDKFKEGVKKTCKKIDDMCDEGDRELRFLNGDFKPSDIIQERKVVKYIYETEKGKEL